MNPLKPGKIVCVTFLAHDEKAHLLYARSPPLRFDVLVVRADLASPCCVVVERKLHHSPALGAKMPGRKKLKGDRKARILSVGRSESAPRPIVGRQVERSNTERSREPQLGDGVLVAVSVFLLKPCIQPG